MINEERRACCSGLLVVVQLQLFEWFEVYVRKECGREGSNGLFQMHGYLESWEGGVCPCL